jgi:hypothetical protein
MPTILSEQSAQVFYTASFMAKERLWVSIITLSASAIVNVPVPQLGVMIDLS